MNTTHEEDPFEDLPTRLAMFLFCQGFKQSQTNLVIGLFKQELLTILEELEIDERLQGNYHAVIEQNQKIARIKEQLQKGHHEH